MKLYLAQCALLLGSCHFSRPQNVPGLGGLSVPGLSAWQAAQAAHAEAERRAGAGTNPALLPSRPVQVGGVGKEARFAAHEAALQLHAQQLHQMAPAGAVPGMSAHQQALLSVQEAERKLGGEGHTSAHQQALLSVQEAERRLGGEGPTSAHQQALQSVQDAERRLAGEGDKSAQQKKGDASSSKKKGGLKINPENVKRIQNSLTQLITSALTGGAKATRGPSSSISDVLSSIIKKRPSPAKSPRKSTTQDRSLEDLLASLGIGNKSNERTIVKSKPKIEPRISEKERSLDEIFASLGIGKISSPRAVIKPKNTERTVDQLTKSISDKLTGRKGTHRFSGGSSRFSSGSSRFSSDSSRFLTAQARKVDAGSTYLDRLLAELREEEESEAKQKNTDFSFLEDTRRSDIGINSFLDDIEPAKDELSSLLEKSKTVRKGLRTNIDKAVEESNQINELLRSLQSSSRPRKVSGSNKKVLLDIVPEIADNEVDIGGDLLKELFSAVPDKVFDDILKTELLKAAKEGSSTTQNSLEREIIVASSETAKLSAELDQILDELEGLTEDKINLVEETFDDLTLKIKNRQATSKYKDLLEDEEFVNSVLERFARLGIPLRPEDIKDEDRIQNIKTTLTKSIEKAAEDSRRLGEELQNQLELLEGERDEGKEKAEGLDTISDEIESLLRIL